MSFSFEHAPFLYFIFHSSACHFYYTTFTFPFFSLLSSLKTRPLTSTSLPILTATSLPPLTSTSLPEAEKNLKFLKKILHPSLAPHYPGCVNLWPKGGKKLTPQQPAERQKPFIPLYTLYNKFHTAKTTPAMLPIPIVHPKSNHLTSNV